MILSVIIPFYKGNKYINRSIESAIKAIRYADAHSCSGLLDDSEILVINDSPEEWVEIRHDYSLVGVLINETNMGVHASRSRGIENSNGVWVHMLDQDDTISEKFYESQFQHTKKADVVVANALMQHKKYSRPLYRSNISLSLVRKPKAYIYFGNRIESPGQCLIKKESIPEAWLKYHQKINGADDLLLWLMMFGENKKFSVNKDVLYKHIYTSENVSLDEENMCNSLEETARIIKDAQPLNPYLKEFQQYISYKRGNFDEVSGRLLWVLKEIDAARDASRKIRG